MANGGEDIVFRIGADVTGLTAGGAKGLTSLAAMEKQAATLKKQIDSIGQAGAEFQRQVNAWAGLTDRAGKSARDAADAFRQFDDAKDAVDDLKASMDPAFAATKRFEAAVRQLDNAMDLGVISAREHADTVAMLRANMGQVGDAATGAAGGGLRMVTQQLSQVGQQTMATGNFVQALAIQLPDIGLAFGAVGTAAGLLAGIALPMVMQAFQDTGQAAEEAKRAMDDMESAVQAYQSAMRDARQPIADLREEYGLMAETARAALQAQADVARVEAIDAVNASVKNLTDSLIYQETVFQDIGTGLQATLIDSFGLADQAAMRLALRLDNLGKAKTLDEQAAAAARVAEALMEAYGSVDAMPGPLRTAYGALQSIQVQAAAVTAEAGRIESALASAVDAATDLAAGVSSLPGIFGSAASNAWNMARGIWDAAKAKAALGTPQQQLDRANMVYGQVGARGDPRSFGSDGAAPFVPVDGAGKGGGGGGGGRGNAEIEALMNGLKSKEEIEAESYAKRQAALEQALQQQLITQEQYQTMMADAARQHQTAMTAIDVYRYGTGLQQAGAFFGDMASAAQSGGSRLLKIAQSLGAAQALIASYQAAALAMATPGLTPFGQLAAYAKVLATGLGAVAAIRGVSAGGGRGGSNGGGGRGTAGGATAGGGSVGVANITLQGEMFSRDSVEQLFRQINDGLKQGRTINLVRT